MICARTFALALLMAPLVSACGLQSMYATGTKGSTASLLREIRVAPVAGKSGWLVRNALRDRLEASRGGDETTALYRLDIKLDDQISGFGVRADDAVTRERRTLRARYQLVEVASGAVLLDATAGSDAGVDVVSSEYATIAAEDSALERLSGVLADQIIARLSLYARRVTTDTPAQATPAPALPAP
jgi:LPS-assembly lipoprotein